MQIPLDSFCLLSTQPPTGHYTSKIHRFNSTRSNHHTFKSTRIQYRCIYPTALAINEVEFISNRYGPDKITFRTSVPPRSYGAGIRFDKGKVTIWIATDQIILFRTDLAAISAGFQEIFRSLKLKCGQASLVGKSLEIQRRSIARCNRNFSIRICNSHTIYDIRSLIATIIFELHTLPFISLLIMNRRSCCLLNRKNIRLRAISKRYLPNW